MTRCNNCSFRSIPANMPDPIQKCLGYGHYSQCAARIGLDQIYIYLKCFIQLPAFDSVSLSKKAWIILCKTGSDLDGLVRVWPNASGLEASWCAGIIWPGFWQDATGPLPVSHFQTRFSSSKDVPDNIARNQPGSDLVLADCVVLWPNGSGPEASRCAGITWPGFWQDATGPLPVSHFQTRFRFSARSDLVLYNCVRFWPKQDPVRKQANVQKSSGPLLVNASKPIQTGCESDPACLLGYFLGRIESSSGL